MKNFFMRNSFYVLLFIILFCITFCYTYFISFLNLDEIWNYGFSYNISSGLVPYKDFNMLQTPLFLFIGSIFIQIFGNHLWSVHIFNALLISFMMLFMHKKIGNKAFVLYPIILIYSVYSYNLFCLFLMILILGILDMEIKYKDYVIPLFVSLIFLSKQNIGICLFIPMLYYSKNKLKSFILFLIPNLIFIIYLIFNNCVYDFINYAFLGMFDFGKSNGIYYFVVFYVLLLIILFYKLFRSKFKNEMLFYILAFQIVGYPIMDDYHFMIGFILVIYYLFLVLKIEKYIFKYLFIISVAFFGIYIYNEQIKLADYDLNNIHLYNDENSFLYGRNFYDKSEELLAELSNYVIDNNEKYKDNIYIFANWAYLIRLNLNDNPGKYDFILDGNMGYKGDELIIDSLEEKCSKENCLFIVQYGGNQVNLNIIEYVVDNYNKIGEVKDIEHNSKIKFNSNYMIYSNLYGDFYE